MSDELIGFFVDEVKELRTEMTNITSKLIQIKMEDVSLFADFGQLVDRIYGTAATLGYEEISEYTKAIKDVTYMAANSDNEEGHKKTLLFMIKYIELNDKICECLHNKDKLSEINRLLKIEISKADILNKKEFYSVEARSCKKE